MGIQHHGGILVMNSLFLLVFNHQIMFDSHWILVRF